jgi:hypothetical protein
MDMLDLIPIGVALLSAGFNTAMFIVVKFNDLHHLTKSVDDIKSYLGKLDTKMDSIGERVSRLEGK